MNKTYVPPQDSIEQTWYVVDAADQRLGRLATEIARILRGKNKPTYTPYMDTGDFVIVVNAEKNTSDWQKTRPETLPPSFR
jgi:large subunit ribosomal protein L13